MSTLRTHFTFRVDTWTPDGESIVEHIAGVEDYQVCTRHFPRRLRTLARHAHHLAAGRASYRGQPAPCAWRRAEVAAVSEPGGRMFHLPASTPYLLAVVVAIYLVYMALH